MNLYFLLAIALGAISGFSEPAAVSRPSVGIVNTCGIRSDEQAIDGVRSRLLHVRPTIAAPRVLDAPPVRSDAPLTGAAAPRAPASNC